MESKTTSQSDLKKPKAMAIMANNQMDGNKVIGIKNKVCVTHMWRTYNNGSMYKLKTQHTLQSEVFYAYPMENGEKLFFVIAE